MALRAARWRCLALGGPILALAGVFVHVTPGADRFFYEPQEYVRLGNAYASLGRPDEACTAYRQAAEQSPSFLTAHFKLGSLLAKSGRLEEGLVELRRALTCQPRLLANETNEMVAAVHSNLGAALAQAGAPADAIQHYRTASELSSGDAQADAQFNLGMLLANAGQTDAAIMALERAVAGRPSDREARQWLARRLLEVGRVDEALGHYRAAAQLDPQHAESLFELAGLLFAMGRDEEALEPLRRYVARDPSQPRVLDRASAALLRVGRYAEARDLLQRSLPQRDALLTNRLAFLLATCPDDSIRNGTEALRLARLLCPQIEACPPAVLDTLAAALAESGQPAQAANVARRALGALRAASQPGEAALADELAARLQKYEAGQPFRLPRHE